jgi:hypothetical protein
MKSQLYAGSEQGLVSDIVGMGTDGLIYIQRSIGGNNLIFYYVNEVGMQYPTSNNLFLNYDNQ